MQQNDSEKSQLNSFKKDNENFAVSENKKSKLSNFPIMFYAVIMGLGGLSLAYEKIMILYQLPNSIFEILRYFTTIIFLTITMFYAAKIIKFPKQVKTEFSHPIKINFFAAFSISLILLSLIWKEYEKFYSFLFYSGTIIQTFLTFYIISFWINKNFLINHSNPAWFIPIVGNLIVVIAGKNNDFLWYYFSIGIFFWIILFGIVFYRIIFHDQLAQKFMPTLFIIIAPPAIGFLGYIKLTSTFDVTAHIFLNLTLFFVFLILCMFKNFTKLKFFLSWWAFTFPTAASSMAFAKAYELNKEIFFMYMATIMFLILIFLILLVGYFTIKAIYKQEICKEE